MAISVFFLKILLIVSWKDAARLYLSWFDLIFFDFDKKRLVYKLEMIHKKEKYLASTTEVCSLYVDLNSRRVTEFEDNKRDLIQSFVDENKDKFNSENLHLINKLKK